MYVNIMVSLPNGEKWKEASHPTRPKTKCSAGCFCILFVANNERPIMPRFVETKSSKEPQMGEQVRTMDVSNQLAVVKQTPQKQIFI